MKGNPAIGLQYVRRGFAALKTPGLRRYVALPLLMNIIIMSAATWWGGTKVSGWIDQLVSWLPGWLEWLYWLLMPLALLTLLFIMAYLFSTVLVTLASPFNGLLSEGVERQQGNVLPEESLWSITKRTFARELTKLGVRVEVFDKSRLKRLRMRALLGVAQGSAHDPRVVVMRWNGAPRSNKKPIAFIGKGVTFDSGGISIKPSSGMEEMKWDMGGAGTVAGLMCALAGRKAKVNAIGAVGLVENMPSATAQRPGDVVRALSGKTIEVINTDAEGRLVLADVLWYVQNRFKPAAMIDLATLTGAMIVALGHNYAGLFSNNDELSERLTKAGEATGERVWRMPLHESYEPDIKSQIADIKNVGAGRSAGSITAALFLQHFVNDVPWAHLDIAGMAWCYKATPTVPKGGSGYGVRLLDRLVADHYEAGSPRQK